MPTDLPVAEPGGAPFSEAVLIEPAAKAPLLDLAELLRRRDLLLFMVTRDLKVRYAQSVLGLGWAVLTPVASMLVFTIVFGRLAGIASEGVPYMVFSYCALVPWSFFAAGVNASASSLVRAQNLLNKVYFPRLYLPLAPILSVFPDFCISSSILAILLWWFGLSPTVFALCIPLLVFILMLTAFGMGLWLTALAVRWRDVEYGKGFLVQLLLYLSPVIYSASVVKGFWAFIYGLNPMVGVIAGFRAALLGKTDFPWMFVLEGLVVSLGLAASGLVYFRKMEKTFADVA